MTNTIIPRNAGNGKTGENIFDAVRDAVKRDPHRWHELLGLDTETLSRGIGTPCPICCHGEGTDRLHKAPSFNKDGSVRCRQGTVYDAIDALITSGKAHDKPDAAKMILDHYGESVVCGWGLVDGGKKNTNHKPQSTNHSYTPWTWGGEPDRAAIRTWCEKHKPGITLDAVLRCGGTTGEYNGHAVLVFPMLDADFNVTGQTAYRLDGRLFGGDKKIHTLKGSKSGFIGTLDQLRDLGGVETVIHTEGVSDLLAVVSHIPEEKRDKIAVFTNGCGANENPGKPYTDLFRAISSVPRAQHAAREVIMIGDNDEAGQQGLGKWTKFALSYGFDVYTWTPPKMMQGDCEVKDVRDFFLSGGVLDDILRLAEPRTGGESDLRIESGEGEPDAESPAIALPTWEPFPVDCLPEVLRDYVQEESAAIGCDPIMVVSPLLAALAGSIGATVKLCIKDTWTVPAILWTVVIADSGAKKSPPFRRVAEFFAPCEQLAWTEYEEQKETFQREIDVYDADYKKWIKDPNGSTPPIRPIKPTERRFVINDVTVESTAKILSENPRGLTLLRDELAGWFGSFNQYKRGVGSDQPFWLECFDAGKYNVDRKGDAEPIHVSRCCVSIGGTIQPGTFKRSFAGLESIESGLLARFLLAAPPSRTSLYTENVVSPETRQRLQDVFDTLLELDFPSSEREALANVNLDPQYVFLTPEAKSLFIATHNEMEQEKDTLPPALRSVWSKMPGKIARIALILHLVKYADAFRASKHFQVIDRQPVNKFKVDAETMESAIRIGRWFAAEQKRCYALFCSEHETEPEADQRELKEILVANGGRLTLREISRKKHRFQKTDRLQSAISQLVSKGEIQTEEVIPKNGGTKSVVVSLV